jgi:hypothetical protein
VRFTPRAPTATRTIYIVSSAIEPSPLAIDATGMEAHMIRQLLSAAAIALLLATMGSAQGTTPAQGNWKPSGSQKPAASRASSDGTPASLDSHKVQPAKSRPVSRGRSINSLPKDHGQVWKQYDISGYTSKVKEVENPQQAVIDWVLRETGTDVWFSEPLGLLSADQQSVRVYHTPEMQEIVAKVIDQFVEGSYEPHVLGLRVVTVNSPNWRSNMMHLMRPIGVKSPGIDAWLLSRENAAMLFGELSRRADFREQSAPHLVFFNGQTQTVSQLRPRNYVRSIAPAQNAWMGYQPEMAQLQEGFTLQISPLLTPDERTVDAVLKCNIDQIEDLVSVTINVPGMGGAMQQLQVQVPQIASWRLHERFRWPADQVLLLSCGVVASPGPDRPTTFGIPNPFSSSGGRANALLFIDCRGKASQAMVTGAAATVGSRDATIGARY